MTRFTGATSDAARPSQRMYTTSLARVSRDRLPAASTEVAAKISTVHSMPDARGEDPVAAAAHANGGRKHGGWLSCALEKGRGAKERGVRREGSGRERRKRVTRGE